MKRLLDWLNGTLEIQNVGTEEPWVEAEDGSGSYQEVWSYTTKEPIPDATKAIAFKNDPRYLLHPSNHVKRLDGRQYGAPAPKAKLRKV